VINQNITLEINAKNKIVYMYVLFFIKIIKNKKPMMKDRIANELTLIDPNNGILEYWPFK
jgi:hypothetical protein